MISEERQAHFAHLIIDGIWQDELAEYEDDDRALRIAKRVITQFAKEVDDVDDQVRNKLHSMQRTVIEGSNEWNALYEKFYQEELRRRGQSV